MAGAASQGINPQSINPQVSALGTATALSAEAAVRVLNLQPGQQVQGTVVKILGSGKLLMGLMGGLVEASSKLNLSVGKSYNFSVAQVQPRIVLQSATPLVLPGLQAAAQSGILGQGGKDLGVAMQQLADLLPAPAPKLTSTLGGKAAGELSSPLQQGSITASDLQEVQRRLGYDQEVRVLRLPKSNKAAPQVTQTEVMSLRHSLKAEALQLLDATNTDAVAAKQRNLAQALVAGFNAIEADNAQRAEQGVPQWLPLPVAEAGELMDARMFLLPSDADSGAENQDESEQRPVNLVLLLEFTRLGSVRADVQVQGEAVSVILQLVDSSAFLKIGEAVPALRSMLEAHGLKVGQLLVKQVPGKELPSSDLVSLPSASRSLVDIHA